MIGGIVERSAVLSPCGLYRYLLARGFSIGGDGVRWCQRAAFRLWIRTYEAKPTRTTRKRSLMLRPLRVLPPARCKGLRRAEDRGRC